MSKEKNERKRLREEVAKVEAKPICFKCGGPLVKSSGLYWLCERAEAAERELTEAAFLKAGADRLADEAEKLIVLRQLDSRSGLADAALDYRDPDRPRIDTIIHLTERAEAAEKRVAELTKPLTLDEARQKRLCRICGKDANAPLTLNYGAEFAHTACLEREQQATPDDSTTTTIAAPTLAEIEKPTKEQWEACWKYLTEEVFDDIKIAPAASVALEAFTFQQAKIDDLKSEVTKATAVAWELRQGELAARDKTIAEQKAEIERRTATP